MFFTDDGAMFEADKWVVDIWHADVKTMQSVFNHPDYDLMLFIGITDVSGRKIYEGDIERDVDGNTWCWRWKPSSHGFEPEMLVENTKILSLRGEVVGNVFENPELLNN